MEQQDPLLEEESSDHQAKDWIQENLRVIVSVFIVAAIALGIYSYSQRTQTIADNSTDPLIETRGGSDETTTTNKNASVSSPSDQDDNTVRSSQSDAETRKAVEVTAELSQETDTSFIEKAEKGNGATHLARRALAQYLEKNVDSSLSAEQKVYIEDYLRKNVDFKGSLTPGASIEFSKALISQGIEKSKTLNDRQLQNLKKYSARVSAYR